MKRKSKLISCRNKFDLQGIHNRMRIFMFQLDRV